MNRNLGSGQPESAPLARPQRRAPQPKHQSRGYRRSINGSTASQGSDQGLPLVQRSGRPARVLVGGDAVGGGSDEYHQGPGPAPDPRIGFRR